MAKTFRRMFGVGMRAMSRTPKIRNHNIELLGKMVRNSHFNSHVETLRMILNQKCFKAQQIYADDAMNAPTPPSPTSSREIRSLDFREVCSLDVWLARYMRLELEDGRMTNSNLLLHVLVRSNREYESDFGVFGVE